MKRLRGGSGLGDSIYLRPLVDHFARAGDPVAVLTDYPDIFRGADCSVEPFGRNNVQIVGHYVVGKRNPATNQWQDICASAGVAEVPLRFDWKVQDRALVESILADAAGRPLILVHGGRVPMGRTDGFGKELLPERSAFAVALAELADCFTVRVGKGADLYPLDVSVDLNGSTSVADLLDIASICDGAVGQCSFIIPLSEAFDKPLLCVWAAHGLQYNMHPYIQSITPGKVLSKPTSRFVIDDWDGDKIRETAKAFRGVILEDEADGR